MVLAESTVKIDSLSPFRRSTLPIGTQAAIYAITHGLAPSTWRVRPGAAEAGS